MNFVYYFDNQAGQIKIGKTANIERRLNDMRCAIPKIKCAAFEQNGFIEQTRHAQFAQDHISGEWFRKSERLSSWISFLNAITRVDSSLRAPEIVVDHQANCRGYL